MIGRGWHIVAIDISPRAVMLTRSIIREIAASGQRSDCKDTCSKGLTEDVEPIAADGRLLPFRDGAFDAVFAFHVLGHLLGPERSVMAGEIIRVTRRGGLVFFRGFSFDDLRAGGDEIEERTFIRGDGTITHYFTEEEVLQIFRQLSSTSVTTVRWSMRVGGLDLIRSEIRAAFRKE
jgi:SAM-dependent methyltransferase